MRIELFKDPKSLRKIRKIQGIPQGVLAERAGLSQPSLWAIETGKAPKVSIATMHRIDKALDSILSERARLERARQEAA